MELTAAFLVGLLVGLAWKEWCYRTDLAAARAEGSR